MSLTRFEVNLISTSLLAEFFRDTVTITGALESETFNFWLSS